MCFCARTSSTSSALFNFYLYTFFFSVLTSSIVNYITLRLYVLFLNYRARLILCPMMLWLVLVLFPTSGVAPMRHMAAPPPSRVIVGSL